MKALDREFKINTFRDKFVINLLFLFSVCFGIYDLNDDGYISREEMFQMLKNTMVKQPSEEDPDEGIKDLVETMIKRMVG